jgi:quinol monooxygenase YgiN
MIYVIATIELVPGQRAAFLAEFHQLVPQVLREAGGIEYMPTIDAEAQLAVRHASRPEVVTIVEKWEDIPSLQAHLAAPHMLIYREKVKPLVKQVTLQILSPA